MTMARFRVRAYDDEHHATLIVETDVREWAGVVAAEFVAAMHLGYYPADHSQRGPELVPIETATSWFDADAPFPPVVESIEAIDPDPPGRPGKWIDPFSRYRNICGLHMCNTVHHWAPFHL